MTHTTRREAMALISAALAGTALGGNAFAQGTPKRGGILLRTVLVFLGS